VPSSRRSFSIYERESSEPFSLGELTVLPPETSNDPSRSFSIFNTIPFLIIKLDFVSPLIVW